MTFLEKIWLLSFIQVSNLGFAGLLLEEITATNKYDILINISFLLALLFAMCFLASGDNNTEDG